MLRIRDAALFCGVHPNTLRAWNCQSSTTKGKHRLYTKRDLCNIMRKKYIKPGTKFDIRDDIGGRTEPMEKFVYCRVSSASQKDDLKRQIQCMSEQYPGYSVLSDVASGINFRRRSLQSLLEKVMRGTVSTIVVSHRDRLARFGFELIELICKFNGEQESTSKKRKRGEKEKSEEQKRKLKEARMLKAHQQKEKRRQALEKMKAELGSRDSLTIPIEDPEELKKIERKEELRQGRVIRKQDTETPKPKAKRPQRIKTATITKSFSVRIKPTKDQRDILNHWIGCARFTYNQGLSIVKDFTSREDRPSINESLFMTIKGQLVPYDKVDRDKPWLHNCPEKIRAYAVHKELYRTYKSNFERGVRDFEPKFRKKYGLQSIHMPKDKVVYCRKSQTLRLFPNHKMKTEHFKNLSGDDNGKITSGEYHIFGPKYRKTKTSTTAGDRKRSKKKTRLIEKCFKENGKAIYDVTFVRTATNKYELRLTFDESVEDVQERNLLKNPSKKFDSVFIDPGNRTFSTMYSPEGFSGSIGDKDISRMFGLLKTHDELQSEGAKKNNNKRKRRSSDEEGEGDKSKTEQGDPNSLNGESKIQLAVIREKIKNLRDEVHWQTISFLLRNFKNIFIPKLDTNRMVLKGSRKLNKTAARQMLTWSHGLFIERLVSKSREFRDTHVHIVDECYTSKTCGECGTINESLGSSKWFSCRSCGFECERDLNGARNIFIKAVCEGVLTIS